LKSWQIPERISFLEKSVKLNPKSSRYKIDLSNSYLTQALNEIQKPAEARDQRLILDSMAKAINFAKGLKNEIEIKGATEISPNWVLVWENLARIYREIIPFVENPQIALEHGIKSFEKAIKLEGKNPILHTELGKLYLLKGEIEKAESEFKKAVELKEDYLDGKIQLALIFERKGDFDQAIKKMEEIVKNFPFNVEAHFQLGRLYFNRDRIDEAILQFEMAISIMPNHSNSLYSLGIAYERKGEKEKALEYFQKVLELNPGNPEVLRKIEELK
jgi:tetratricopeptide (TPR) repeat protein